MKKIFLILALISGIFIFNASAQISLSINIGSQPVWGPSGYDHADYYYMPDIDAYYYVPKKQFIYQQGKRWVFSNSLPPMYRNYDLYNGYKVVLNEPKPYLHNDVYKNKYSSFRGKKSQQAIRDNHEEKYWQVANHPDHNKWKGNNGKGKNKGQHQDDRGKHGH